MSQIWGMINGMQIYSHLPVINIANDIYTEREVIWPTTSETSLESIQEIADFSVIPLDELLEIVLPSPDGDGEDLFSSAEDIGFESYYMLKNLGTLFASFVGLITIPLLILVVFSPCKNKSSRI